tara:strand:- start:166031 stop:166234 length:204 start_codon:yes stop_codon:yes gene_type:complete
LNFFHWIYLTDALKGKYAAIEDMGKGISKLFFRNLFLGFFDENNIRHKQISIKVKSEYGINYVLLTF